MGYWLPGYGSLDGPPRTSRPLGSLLSLVYQVYSVGDREDYMISGTESPSKDVRDIGRLFGWIVIGWKSIRRLDSGFAGEADAFV